MSASTQQGLRHASFRTIAGTEGAYDDDFMAAMQAELEGASQAVPSTYNGRMIAWLRLRPGSSKSDINDLMALFAQQWGADTWGGVGTIEPYSP